MSKRCPFSNNSCQTTCALNVNNKCIIVINAQLTEEIRNDTRRIIDKLNHLR